MGNEKSNIAPHSKRKKCGCSLYTTTQHCCNNECFNHMKDFERYGQIPHAKGKELYIFSEKHQNALIEAMASHNLDMDFKYIVSIVHIHLTYYPDIHRFYTYCHNYNHLNQYTLCKQWLKHINKFLSISVIGDSKSGKTTLILRFQLNTWLKSSDPSLKYAEKYRKLENVGGYDIIYDIQDGYNIKYGVFLLVFGVDQQNALDSCIHSWENIKRIKGEGAIYKDHSCSTAVILVGAKFDLMYEKQHENYKDLIQRYEENAKKAKELSKIWNIPYIETSAQRNINVYLLFKQIPFEYWVQTQTESVNWATTQHKRLLSDNK